MINQSTCNLKDVEPNCLQAFTLGSLRVEVGDHVLVKSVDTVRGLEECDVVRVERLYRDYSNTADPHRAVVSWLCRPDFLPPVSQLKIA